MNPEVMDAELQFATRRGRERLSEKPALCNNWLCESKYFSVLAISSFQHRKTLSFLSDSGWTLLLISVLH